jgi:hypothetical protein
VAAATAVPEHQPTMTLQYQIASLSEMTAHFPQLAAVADGRASCAISEIKKRPRKNKDPLVEKSLALSESVGPRHEKGADVDPWKMPLFAHVLSRLPKYKWVEMSRAISNTNSARVERMLRLNQADLFLSKSIYESVLLGESGSFIYDGKMVTYPPCVHGIKCKGMDKNYRYRNQERDVIWMSYLYPTEYSSLNINGFYSGNVRPCLLCLRDMALETEIAHRLIDRKSSINGSKVNNESEDNKEEEEEEDNDEGGDYIEDFVSPPCQIFYNLIDQVNGYHKDYVIVSEPGRPLICPIARPNLSLLVAYNGEGNRLMVNQSAIMWKSPILSSPQAGENIQGF